MTDTACMIGWFLIIIYVVTLIWVLYILFTKPPDYVPDDDNFPYEL